MVPAAGTEVVVEEEGFVSSDLISEVVAGSFRAFSASSSSSFTTAGCPIGALSFGLFIFVRSKPLGEEEHGEVN